MKQVLGEWHEKIRGISVGLRMALSAPVASPPSRARLFAILEVAPTGTLKKKKTKTKTKKKKNFLKIVDRTLFFSGSWDDRLNHGCPEEANPAILRFYKQIQGSPLGGVDSGAQAAAAPCDGFL